MKLSLKRQSPRGGFSSPPQTPAQHLGHAFSGFILFIVILLFWITLVTLPPLWDFLYKMSMGQKGNVGDSAQVIRALWSGHSFIDLSTQLDTGKLGTKEVAHYRDIRHGLYLGLLVLTLGGTYLLSFARGISWRHVTRWTLFFCLLLFAIGITWALLDWRHFFRTLHWWVFRDNSWMLPLDSTTLALFPYPVWQWTFSIIATATALTTLALAYLLRRP